jgi:putative spermidine/putrescine transport system substrate-binding protein
VPRVSLLIVAALLALAAGCGSTVKDPTPGPKVTPPPGVRPVADLRPAEDSLKLVAPSDYAEVGDFERETGCAVDVTPAETTDDVVRLLSTGRYDGGLGTGDAMVRLIASGSIGPVNTRLVPNYQDVYDGLKDQPYNAVGGQMFALPVGRAANVLLYRRDKVPGTLTGLAAVLDGPQVASYGGQVVAPDDPANIAEAALWVARQRKELEITDPYELDRRQFNAVLDVLRLQKPYIETYWTTDEAPIADFRSGEAIVGMVSQQAAGVLDQEGHPEGPFEMTLPKEGSTGISPAWMVSDQLQHPGCMYRWLDHVLDPAVEAVVARSAAIAPANRRTCEEAEDETPLKVHCELFHADDDGYYDKVLFRTTPARDCGDARGRVCQDYDAWRRAWDEITAP